METLSLRHYFLTAIILFLTGCGGSGGSSNGTTEEGTTPIDENNERTLHGTYDVTYFEITDGVEKIRSTELDFFEHRFTINIDTRMIAQRIEMRDGDLGIDFFDYSEDSIDASPTLSISELYANQTGPYTLTIFYNDVCDASFCFDMLLRLRKTSDQIQTLLLKSAASMDKSVTFKQRLARLFLRTKYSIETNY